MANNSKTINELNKLKKKKAPRKTPRTSQDTLPYIAAYENGAFQTEPGRFTKTFAFDDISFKTKSDEEQNEIYEFYMKFLNSLAAGEDLFYTFVNTSENNSDVIASVVPQTVGDEYDVYRKEMSDMIRQKMKSSRNNIRTRKYLTTRVEKDDVEEAMDALSDAEMRIAQDFRKITKQNIKPLNLAERLEVMNDILNGQSEPNLWFEHDIQGKVSVDFHAMARQGLTTKDIIAPEVIKFDGAKIQLGERYGQAMYLDEVANWMNSNFLSDLAAVNFEMCVTLHIAPVPQDKALKLIHNQSVNINAEVIQRATKLANQGTSPEFISADLKNAKDQIDMLQEDLMNRDQKLFFGSLVLVHFADDPETLKKQTKVIKNIGLKYMCSIKTLLMRQERGLRSALPTGIDDTFVKRLLTTESLGLFIPFDEVNQFDKGGFYYGMNSINRSLIVYNRLKGQNYNGLVLGSSGSGKSFSAKREMVSAILNTKSDVFIVDPDGEYSPIAEAFGGSIIKIAPGNGVYINPLDLDIDTSQDMDSNPITMKTDFICGMLETMLGAGARLTPTQKSIVDRCVKQIYRPYLEHLAEMPLGADGKKRTIDREFCPTLQNLFSALLSQPQPEAQNLALVMETYTTGTFDTFAHRTNVDVSNRIIVYDIKNIGSNLRELALKVCLNDVWNKTMENKRRGRWTWFYIDEFHLLLSNQSTSEFLKTVWKRARKWQGVPTGITQNVEDLLESTEARAIINNSSFVYMMNQSAMDRNMLGELMNLTAADKEYITNAEPGCGLIYTGKQTIPFSDHFPENTELYKIMTTKPEDSE